VPIIYNGRPYPPEIAPSNGGSGLPCNTWCLGPMRAHSPNGTSIGWNLADWKMADRKMTDWLDITVITY